MAKTKREFNTDGESLAVPVSNVINQFSLGMKVVVITSDGGTNLAICKAILESTFDNTVLFDLVKLMFVMGFLSPVLSGDCKAGAMYVKYDDVRVYTELTRSNMQHCINWKKNHQRGQRLWRQRRSMCYFLVRVLLQLSKLVLPIQSTPFGIFLKIRDPSTTLMDQ